MDRLKQTVCTLNNGCGVKINQTKPSQFYWNENFSKVEKGLRDLDPCHLNFPVINKLLPIAPNGFRPLPPELLHFDGAPKPPCTLTFGPNIDYVSSLEPLTLQNNDADSSRKYFAADDCSAPWAVNFPGTAQKAEVYRGPSDDPEIVAPLLVPEPHPLRNNVYTSDSNVNDQTESSLANHFSPGNKKPVDAVRFGIPESTRPLNYPGPDRPELQRSADNDRRQPWFVNCPPAANISEDTGISEPLGSQERLGHSESIAPNQQCDNKEPWDVNFPDADEILKGTVTSPEPQYLWYPDSILSYLSPESNHLGNETDNTQDTTDSATRTSRTEKSPITETKTEDTARTEAPSFPRQRPIEYSQIAAPETFAQYNAHTCHAYLTKQWVSLSTHTPWTVNLSAIDIKVEDSDKTMVPQPQG